MYVSLCGVDCTKYVQRNEYSVYNTDELADEWQSASGKHHEALLRKRVVGTIKFAFVSEQDYADFLTLFNTAVIDRVLTISVHVMDEGQVKEIQAFYTLAPEKYINYDLDYMGVINILSLQIREV